jgi:hypothetical protein
MAISPVDVATSGYLNSPLSAASDGYLTLFTVVTKPKGGGGTGGLQDPRYYTITPEKLDELRAQLEREEEEIIAIIMVAMEVLQ